MMRTAVAGPRTAKDPRRRMSGAAAPAGQATRDSGLETLATRVRLEATARGVTRLRVDGHDAAPETGRRHIERARTELSEYLRGRRTVFTVPLDLGELPPFQAQVLEEVLAIPFGQVLSYADIARRIGHPRAARAVGNAVARNPVPILVPCHRVIRLDGTWGHYAFGGDLKTSLLRLERTRPSSSGRSRGRSSAVPAARASGSSARKTGSRPRPSR
jgi:methylated-DNA-[protein]-cysteine S-methyltransferase